LATNIPIFGGKTEKKPLAELIPENFAQEFIFTNHQGLIRHHDAEKFLSSTFNNQFIADNLNADFLGEIIVHPHVVISFKEIDLNSRICHFG
jgi:hypothetical protein